MRLKNDSKGALSGHLSSLLERRADVSRLNLSRQMGVADGTLGRIKYGTGNPTLEVVDQIGNFFQVPTWKLLRPTPLDSGDGNEAVDVGLLARALAVALSAFHAAGRNPSNEQLAAAATFVYAHARRGVQLDAAANSVRELIDRAGGRDIGLEEDASA